MEQIGKVTAVYGRYADVEIKRLSACDSCHKKEEGGCSVCSLMSGSSAHTARAKNTASAKVGDRVLLVADDRRILGYSAAVFLLPIVLAALAYFIAFALDAAQWIGGLAAAFAFAVSFVLLYFTLNSYEKNDPGIRIAEVLEEASDLSSEILFRSATEADANGVLALYRSAIGSEFCVWSEYYPGMREIEGDLAASSLYLLTCDRKIVAAASVVPENELDGVAPFECTDGSAKEIARVVVSPEYRGRRLAAHLVGKIIECLRSRDCRALHLSVAKCNIPAYKTYRSLGFNTVGEAELYGGSYYIMELLLSTL